MFEFGRGLIINYRVIPLEGIFSFRSVTLIWMYSMYEVEIACVDTSLEYAAKVQIWSWYNNFFYRVIPLEKKFRLLFGCMYKVEIACVDTS